MSTSDVVTLFDVGAGQVSIQVKALHNHTEQSQAQGSRPFQEDRCVVAFPEQFPSKVEDKVAFFAIYDGQ